MARQQVTKQFFVAWDFALFGATPMERKQSFKTYITGHARSTIKRNWPLIEIPTLLGTRVLCTRQIENCRRVNQKNRKTPIDDRK
jgi:hypothetical protein